MKLHELFGSVPIRSYVMLEVQEKEGLVIEEVCPRFSWCEGEMLKQFERYKNCEVKNITADVECAGLLRVVVLSCEGIERTDGGEWRYISPEGDKYDLAELVTPDGSRDYDMMVLMRYFETENSFGYNIINYVAGGSAMSDEELVAVCRHYIAEHEINKGGVTNGPLADIVGCER